MKYPLSEGFVSPLWIVIEVKVKCRYKGSITVINTMILINTSALSNRTWVFLVIKPIET